MALIRTPGVDVNAVDDLGNNALYGLVKTRCKKASKLLIETAGFDPTSAGSQWDAMLGAHSPDFWTFLMSIRFNDLPVFMLYMRPENRAPGEWSLNEGHPFDPLMGWTALHHAVYYSRDEMLELLLAEADVDVSAKTAEGFTPLDVAVAMNRPGIVRALIGRDGVDATALLNGESAVHTAIYWEYQEVIEILAERVDLNSHYTGDGSTVLDFAVTLKRPRSLETLLAAGADPAARSQTGLNAMHKAASIGYNFAIETLAETEVLEAK